MDKLTFTSVRALAQKYDYFLFDCDGVLWHGEKIQVGQAFKNIQWLESMGKKVFFITNNAGESRQTMVDKMKKDVFGYANPKLDSMYPASTIAAQYVKQFMPDCKKVRYIGMEPMGEELRAVGLETEGGTKGDSQFDGSDNYITYEDISNLKFDPEIKAVVTGFDRAVSYSKISLASFYLQKGAKWIVTNDDAYTMQHGLRAPGNGMIISAIESGLKKPGSGELICEKVITGKPNKAVVDLIRGQHGIPEDALSKMIMFGDRCNTDVAMGNNAGIDSCLVLTGVVKNEEEAFEWIKLDEKHRPTYLLESFGEDVKLTEEELAKI